MRAWLRETFGLSPITVLPAAVFGFLFFKFGAAALTHSALAATDPSYLGAAVPEWAVALAALFLVRRLQDHVPQEDPRETL